MKIILVVIIVILILLCFLLLAPIHYEFSLKKDGEMEIKADVNYPFDIIRFHLDYFLLMRFDLKIFGIKAVDNTIDLSANKVKGKKKKVKEDKKNKKDNSIISKIKSLKIKDKLSLISNLKKDFPRALKKIKPKYSDIVVELGFRNPFLLGALLGLLSTVKLILKDLKIYPNFNERVFKINMNLRSNIRLITLLIIALQFRFSKKYRQIF